MGYILSYKCQCCSKTFKLDTKPTFCPYCAADGTNVKIDSKIRESAMSMIEEHDRLMKEMLAKFDEYAQAYVKVEYVRDTLRTYKSRGIIQDDEMPDFTKPKLLDYLKKYRKVKNNRI